MDDVRPKWVVVCEAKTDFRVASILVEREIGSKLEWAKDSLDIYWQWEGIEEASNYTEWKKIKQLALDNNVKVHGQFGKGHQGGGFVEARKALLLVESSSKPVQAVLLERDTDSHKARALGYQEARSSQTWSFPVVLALPYPEIEAWILAGFEPDNKSEERLLTSERKRLGFDPRKFAEKLNPGRDNVKKGTKKVLKKLTDQDPERQKKCLTEAPLDLLKSHGTNTGLKAFLDEVDKQLVPLVGSFVDDV